MTTTTHRPAAAPHARAARPPLVIAGHGTRVELGAEDAAQLAEKVRRLLPGVRVESGYVELTEPPIEDALDAVLAEADAAVVVPLMIGTGGHVREDIPDAIDRASARRPDATVVYTRHLGAPPPMLAALNQRIAAARADWSAEDTDVVLVGRGCSVADANADHVRLARMVFESGGYARVHPAFIQVARPSLPQALAEAYACGARRIVVAPHFLFTGRLDEWTNQQARAFADAHPDAEVRVADVIGPCDELARVVAARYAEGARRARTGVGSPAYLSGLLLEGRKVVVAGGGCVARRRVPRLIEAGAHVEVIAPKAHPVLVALAEQGRLTWHARPITDADLDDAWYVVAATRDADTNAAIAAAAEQRHTFCVRADSADAGSAWTPATGDAAGVTIAAVANHDPVRARTIRDRLLAVVHEEEL